MASSVWDLTPRESVDREYRRRGTSEVVSGCLALLDGEIDPELLRALAGPGADKFLDGAEHTDTYWLRVWALRGLGWAWDPRATPAVESSLRDPHWRVREMALKIVARHLLGDAVPAASDLRDDPVPRVRQAAERALVRLIASGR